MEKETETRDSSKTVEEELNGMRERFLDEREDWRNRIKEMAERIRDVHNLAELQVDLYTSRQEAVEYQYNITMSISRVESRLNKKKKKLIEELNNMDVRYGRTDMNNLIDGACSDHIHHINIMKSHSGYMYETIKTLDSMIFGIKHRLDLENFRTR
jgi:hypothetical protein